MIRTILCVVLMLGLSILGRYWKALDAFMDICSALFTVAYASTAMSEYLRKAEVQLIADHYNIFKVIHHLVNKKL